MASASHLHAGVRNFMLTWIAADKAAHFLQTTDQPPSVPWTQGSLRLPIIMILSAKKAAISQEVGQAQKTFCICPFAGIAVLHFIAFCRSQSLTQHTHTVSLVKHSGNSVLDHALFTLSLEKRSAGIPSARSARPTAAGLRQKRPASIQG